MKRRAFIKSSCNLCLLGTAGYFLSQLAACSPASYSVFKTEVINDEIKVPLTNFTQSSVQFVRPKGWYYDIAVQKNGDNQYEALLMKCTHQDNQLTPTGSGYTCSLHGSQFDKEGHATKGPAEQPLKTYRTSISKDQLTIYTK
jgi:Rieske Fe-S protein